MTFHDQKRPPLITPEVPALYNSAIKEVAASWNDETPEYTKGEPGSIHYYTTMRDILTNRMIEAEPTVERVALSESNQAGLEVISRFFYTGAAKAALQGYSATQLQSALYQPTSFRQLISLTRETVDSARRIETVLGLKDYSTPNLKEFNLDEEGLSIPQYAVHRYRARSSLQDEGRLTPEQAYPETPDDDPIRCTGLTSGVTTYAYKYILEICMKDPALFAATIEPAAATN